MKARTQQYMVDLFVVHRATHASRIHFVRPMVRPDFGLASQAPEFGRIRSVPISVGINPKPSLKSSRPIKAQHTVVHVFCISWLFQCGGLELP